MIIVTGATGKLGQLVVQHLLKRVPASQIGVSVRDPRKAATLASAGVRVRLGDFAHPETLPHAFDGGTHLLLISSSAQAYGGDPRAQHRAAIAAAAAAGVSRIVYTSHMAASLTSRFPPMHTHAATEGLLATAGIAWTAMRNGFYASRAMQDVGKAATSGVIDAPADGKVSWTTHADLAEAAAILLTSEHVADGPTAPLAGPDALDLTDLAAIAAQVLQRPITRHTITDAQFDQNLAQHGLPPQLVTLAQGFFAAARAGEFAARSSGLGEILGRPPESMRTVIATAFAS